MTTTVKVLIEGNKACEVKVIQADCTDDQVSTVQPWTFTTKLIHGEQQVTVKETGDFVS